MQNCKICAKKNNCPFIPERNIPTDKFGQCIEFKPIRIFGVVSGRWNPSKSNVKEIRRI